MPNMAKLENPPKNKWTNINLTVSGLGVRSVGPVGNFLETEVGPSSKRKNYLMFDWLVVSTHLKNISQINWKSCPSKGENKKSLKPTPSN